MLRVVIWWRLAPINGATQIVELFPNVFFAFGQTEKVEQNDDPNNGVGCCHIFKVWHTFLQAIRQAPGPKRENN
jgi:hypothetical protein